MVFIPLKQAPLGADALIAAAGDSIGPGLFLLGNFILLSVDGSKSNAWQQLALVGWITLNISSAFLLPWLKQRFRQSALTQKIGNQDSIHIVTAAGYILFTIAYAYGSYQTRTYDAMGYGIANTLGNVIVLFNKLVLTPERLGHTLGNAEIQRTKDTANWLGVLLRGVSYLSLALMGGLHVVVAALFALALYAIHRRVHLVALTPTLERE